MSDELLTVAQVAERLKVNPETVRRWLRSGQMRGTLLGDRAGWRIPSSELTRLLPLNCLACGQSLPIERRAVGDYPCDRCGKMMTVAPRNDGRLAVMFKDVEDPKVAA